MYQKDCQLLYVVHRTITIEPHRAMSFDAMYAIRCTFDDAKMYHAKMYVWLYQQKIKTSKRSAFKMPIDQPTVCPPVRLYKKCTKSVPFMYHLYWRLKIEDAIDVKRPKMYIYVHVHVVHAVHRIAKDVRTNVRTIEVHDVQKVQKCNRMYLSFHSIFHSIDIVDVRQG